jgi:hypothetical protein
VLTYHQGVFILERIGLHVPNNLVSKELGKLCGFDNVSLDISQRIIPQSLDDLWDIEERRIDGMAFESAHSILNNERIVAI